MKSEVIIHRQVIALTTCCLGSLAVFPATADDGRAKGEEFDERREEILKDAKLWPLPEHRPPVKAFRHKLRELDGYSVENVAIETVPGFFRFGNLYRPLGRKNLEPIILSPFRRSGENRQIVHAHLAKMGAAVFSYETGSRDDFALQIWNAVRAVDFATGLERVDSGRLGVICSSGNAMQWMQLALVDDRMELDNMHFAGEDDYNYADRRKTIYEFLARRLQMRRNPFKAFGERLPRELEIVPEDLNRIRIEPAAKMLSFEDQTPPLLRRARKGDETDTGEFRNHLARLRTAQKKKNASILRLQHAPRAKYAFRNAGIEDERIIFTPPGFANPGKPKVASGPDVGTLEIIVRDNQTGDPTFCRINVVGPDGNYYEPAEHDLKRYSLTGVWPRSGWGNRLTKAPVRYLGRYFYSNGRSAVVKVPTGVVRIEVWKGFEYTPTTVTTLVKAGQNRKVEAILRKNAGMSGEGYWSGDPHIHIQQFDDDDERLILDLLEAEDIRYASALAYNHPPGPYSGFMKRMESPQMRGLGRRSIRSRGDYSLISGEEYRSSTFGHLNLFLLDDLILAGKEHNADDWPPYGHLAAKARESGGIAFYAHGGYAKEIYADVAQGRIDGVELLQFGVYRGIGLDDWYNMLNAGFRVPANGASDYPACRKLGDCKTYVYDKEKPDAAGWLRGMAEGRSFLTSGPLLLLEVDGVRPGGRIDRKANEAVRVKAKIRVRSEVAPVTNVRLIANGRVLHEMTLPRQAGRGCWIESEHEIELEESAWIAARAFSLSPTGAPDAESHTNPVYLYLNGKAPFDVASTDALAAAIDRQIDVHQKRDFAERKQVIAYFQRSRDVLMKLRAAGGAKSTGHPADLAEADPSLDIDPGARKHEDEELKAFLKPVPPKPIENVLKSFETANDFEMQLVAREPLVHDPIAAAFDEWGNLYVCEMRDYPFKPKPGKRPMGTLRLIKDANGDGVFDESHVFADGLLWSGGVAPWKGGVFVTAPPDLWYLKDTDGDNQADVRERVFTGFGTSNQQGMVNNLIRGLDHKIYGATARNGGRIRPGNRPDARPIDIRGQDFRFDPRTREMEMVTGTIQFGNSFDDWGNRFVCSESQPLLQVVLPRRYLERNPHIAVPKAIHNLAPQPVPSFRSSPLERWRQIRSGRRVAHRQRMPTDTGASHHVVDSAAGVTVYRGGAYPPEFDGNIFVGDAQNNFVHRRVLTRDGAVFKSSRADPGTEFVRSSDNWFRPVNFVNAPDGTLYVLDMSREIIETVHVPLDVMKFIDVKHGRGHGRIYRIAPPGFRYPGRTRIGDATTVGLVGHLENPNGWWRETAHRLIFERQDRKAIPALRQLLLNSRKPRTRLLALWSLHGLGSLTAADIALGVGDVHAGVRKHAILLAESRLQAEPELLEALLTATSDPDPLINLQLAFSLGYSRDRRALSGLADIARNFARDQWIRTAVLSSVNELADRLFAELFADRDFIASSSGRKLLQDLLEIVGSRGKPQEVRRVLTVMAEGQESDERDGLALIASLGEALRRAGKSLFDDFSENPDHSAHLNRLSRVAGRLAGDKDSEIPTREEAIRVLGLSKFTTARETLSKLLEVEQPEQVQAAAIRALSAHRDFEVASLLIDNWRNSSPTVRLRSIEALLANEARTIAFLQAAEDGKTSANAIDTARRPLLINHKNPDIRRIARRLFGKETVGNRNEVVARYQTALTLKSDSTRGRKIFERFCMSCHRVDGLGTNLGPDISSGASRNPRSLLVHVLDPNRYLDPRHEVYVCIEKNGQSHVGTITAQTASGITLNGVRTIPRSQIKELTGTGKSLMPEGLESEIGKQDMADLIAWLSSKANKPLHIGTLPGLFEPEK